MKPIIAISMGDFNGIGPEVALKAFKKIDLSASIPIWIGNSEIFHFYNEQIQLKFLINEISDISKSKSHRINILNIDHNFSEDVDPGTITAEGGRMAMEAVKSGIELCMLKKAAALVTAPISKEGISKAGYTFPGHTEFLAEKTDTEKVLMMLVNENLRVALVTIHIPLREVPDSISSVLIYNRLKQLNTSLKNDFGIPKPSIAVLGLNPHAGDGGVIGNEEIDLISPAIDRAINSGLMAEGPFPADGFFGSRLYEQYDAVLAMYHDQGLVPFKALSFGKGVNFTAGLPIIRTSPDHGTAYSIAGKNQADEGSFLSAYQLAVRLAEKKAGSS